jgi:hypothetical protein
VPLVAENASDDAIVHALSVFAARGDT